MSHEITATDHMVSGNNEIPWHKLGTVVAGAMTAEEALVLAHLNWKVSRHPLMVVDGKTFKEQFAIVREDNQDPLGVVGKRYTPIQNVEGLDILDPVIGKDAVYETAGSLRGGKIVWFLASLKAEYFLGGSKKEQMKQYVLIFLSHDGTKPVSVRFVSTRVVCMNTLTAALGEAKSLVVIRHLKNYEDKLEEAHRIMGLANKHAVEFTKVYDGLCKVKMTEKQAANFTTRWLPGKGTKVENTRAQVVELFNRGVGNVGETRADALNAVTEFLTYFKRVRKSRGPEGRFETNTMGYGVDMQTRALELLTAN